MLSCPTQDNGEGVWLAASVIPSRGKYTHTREHTRTDLYILRWNEDHERENCCVLSKVLKDNGREDCMVLALNTECQ